MKIFIQKIIAIGIVAILIFQTGIHAQGVNFANGVFQFWISTHYPSCAFPDGSIDVSCPAITTEDTLNLSGLNISNFDGIQYFTSLLYLDVSNNTSGGLFGGSNLLFLIL